MQNQKTVIGGSDSSHCSSALSQCSRDGISTACEQCGESTPVKMNLGNRYWIRCFMCQHDGPESDTMQGAIDLWETE